MEQALIAESEGFPDPYSAQPSSNHRYSNQNQFQEWMASLANALPCHHYIHIFFCLVKFKKSTNFTTDIDLFIVIQMLCPNILANHGPTSLLFIFMSFCSFSIRITLINKRTIHYFHIQNIEYILNIHLLNAERRITILDFKFCLFEKKI